MKKFLVFILALICLGCSKEDNIYIDYANIYSYDYEGTCWYVKPAGFDKDYTPMILVKENMESDVYMQVNSYDDYCLIATHREDKEAFAWRIKVTDSSYVAVLEFDPDETHFVKLNVKKVE